MCSTNERPGLGRILASHWLVRKSDQKLTDDLCGLDGGARGMLEVCGRDAGGGGGVQKSISRTDPNFLFLFCFQYPVSGYLDCVIIFFYWESFWTK